MQTAYCYIFEWIQYTGHTGVHAHSWHGKALILFYNCIYNRQTLLHQLSGYLFTYSSLWDNTMIQFDDVQILWIPMWTFVMHTYICESAHVSCMLTLYQESFNCCGNHQRLITPQWRGYVQITSFTLPVMSRNQYTSHKCCRRSLPLC